MSYQRQISRPIGAEPARPVIVAIDGGAYVPRAGRTLSPRRRLAIIVAASAGLWTGIFLLVWAALG